MVSLISLQAFFGLAIVVTVGLYVYNRRTDTSTAILGAIGAAILALYLIVGIVLSVTNVI
jgi:hypothetical protein